MAIRRFILRRVRRMKNGIRERILLSFSAKPWDVSDARKKAADGVKATLEKLKQQKAAVEKPMKASDEFEADLSTMWKTTAVDDKSKAPLDTFQGLLTKGLKGPLSDHVVMCLHEVVRAKYRAAHEADLKTEMAQAYRQGFATMLDTIETVVEETLMQHYFKGLEGVSAAGSTDLVDNNNSIYYMDRLLGRTFDGYKREATKNEKLLALVSKKSKEADAYSPLSILRSQVAIVQRETWKAYLGKTKQAFVANTAKELERAKKFVDTF